MIDSMKTLKYLNIGNYTGHAASSHMLISGQHNKQTLQRLFRELTISLSLYDDQYPIEEDPCYIFQDGWIMNTDIDSNPSMSPISTASTIPMEDLDL